METIIEFIKNPWPWYFSGFMISVVMALMLWAEGYFGVSRSLKIMCSMGGAGKKIEFFNFDWKGQLWIIAFVVGSMIGGYIASHFLSSTHPLELSDATISDLASLGINFNGEYLPSSIFSFDGLLTIQGMVCIVLGGFLVGFGTRWANGCTSGHAISGLANFQLGSLIAVIGFFIGGLIITHLVFPILFNLN